MTSPSSKHHLLFSSLSIRAELQQALDTVNYIEMSPIQARSLGPILSGNDVLAEAETGSGKTAAFAIGILNKLNLTLFKTQALVICPTRELSEQVAVEIRRLATGLANTRVLTLCGGKPMHDQLTSLKREPHIVVGTPGRLKKHIEKDTLKLGDINTLVLDEADRMLDMGFYNDIVSILEQTNASKQTLLFSATYPEEIAKISSSIQREPVEVRVVGSNTVEQIEQVFISTPDSQKTEKLLSALGKYQPENAIIFCNRKVGVQKLCDELRSKGLPARALHGDLDQRDRDEATLLFANKTVNYLVATDVAARGLDISALSAVVNYDLTPDPETHLHRIGRTARAGLDGLAISFVTPNEKHRVRAIEDYLQIKARFEEIPESFSSNATSVKPTTCTLQLSVGKKDRIRPGDIVGALTAGSELTNDDIGKITVQARMSFVAVDRALSQTALDLLTNGRIKRQKVRARLIR